MSDWAWFCVSATSVLVSVTLALAGYSAWERWLEHKENMAGVEEDDDTP